MAYKDKVRITFPVTDELEKRIDNMAKRMGTTKSNLCSMLVSQQIDTFEQTWEMMRSGKMNDLFATMMNTSTEKLTEALQNYDEGKENLSNSNLDGLKLKEKEVEETSKQIIDNVKGLSNSQLKALNKQLIIAKSKIKK